MEQYEVSSTPFGRFKKPYSFYLFLRLKIVKIVFLSFPHFFSLRPWSSLTFPNYVIILIILIMLVV